MSFRYKQMSEYMSRYAGKPPETKSDTRKSFEPCVPSERDNMSALPRFQFQSYANSALHMGPIPKTRDKMFNRAMIFGLIMSGLRPYIVTETMSLTHFCVDDLVELGLVNKLPGYGEFMDQQYLYVGPQDISIGGGVVTKGTTFNDCGRVLNIPDDTSEMAARFSSTAVSVLDKVTGPRNELDAQH